MGNRRIPVLRFKRRKYFIYSCCVEFKYRIDIFNTKKEAVYTTTYNTCLNIKIVVNIFRLLQYCFIIIKQEIKDTIKYNDNTTISETKKKGINSILPSLIVLQK